LTKNYEKRFFEAGLSRHAIEYKSKITNNYAVFAEFGTATALVPLRPLFERRVQDMDIEMTLHARERVVHRGVNPALTNLVLEWGEPLSRNPDRLLLTRRRLDRLWLEGKLDRELFLRAEQAVPLVCVVSEGQLVTVFRPSRMINRSFDRRSRRRLAQRRAWVDVVAAEGDSSCVF
jgi:hypothetical protein